MRRRHRSRSRSGHRRWRGAGCCAGAAARSRRISSDQPFIAGDLPDGDLGVLGAGGEAGRSAQRHPARRGEGDLPGADLRDEHDVADPEGGRRTRGHRQGERGRPGGVHRFPGVRRDEGVGRSGLGVDRDPHGRCDNGLRVPHHAVTTPVTTASIAVPAEALIRRVAASGRTATTVGSMTSPSPAAMVWVGTTTRALLPDLITDTVAVTAAPDTLVSAIDLTVQALPVGTTKSLLPEMSWASARMSSVMEVAASTFGFATVALPSEDEGERGGLSGGGAPACGGGGPLHPAGLGGVGGEDLAVAADAETGDGGCGGGHEQVALGGGRGLGQRAGDAGVVAGGDRARAGADVERRRPAQAEVRAGGRDGHNIGEVGRGEHVPATAAGGRRPGVVDAEARSDRFDAFCAAPTMRASSPAATVPALVPTARVALLPSPRLVRAADTEATSDRLFVDSMSPPPPPPPPPPSGS